MRHSKNYNFRLPERVDGRNDPADIDDLTYDLESTDGILKVQDDEDKRLDRDKLDKSSHNQHKTADVLDHPDNSVTDAKIGNRTVLTSSGLLQTLLTAIGTAIKAITGTSTWNATPPTTLTAAKGHMDSRENPHVVTKVQVRLGSVDDTRDMDKPVSTAQAAAIQVLSDTVAGKADKDNVLTKDNTTEFVPTANYHPATKKYIDDQLGEAGSGDMMKAVYDQNNDGIVDRAATCTGNAATATVAASANAVAWGNVNTKPATFPPSSHGNHVPAVQGANNKVFLRNDNTWQTITPANIGAEPTFAKNNAFNKAFGTAAGTVCQGNDARLSNARPASGGNADTVDGFHVAGKGTGRPGSLAENALYFVYE